MSYEEACVFGHEHHDHIVSHNWVLYDWRRYMDLPEGWCPGRCDISRTIDLYGHWENDETVRFIDCLNGRPRGEFEAVIDVGANVGWYSILAAKFGYPVLAVEGITETLDLLMENAEHFVVDHLVTPYRDHWDADTPVSKAFSQIPNVRVLKVDIEGNEPDAIRVLAPLLESRRVEYAMIEASPAFGPHYQPMVQQMFDYGYIADVNGIQLRSSKLDVPQANVWFQRQP